MAIRKDLDDMLNNLKKGGISEAEKQSEITEEQKKKTIYDSMSVDDLLTALSDDKTHEETEKAAKAAEMFALKQEEPAEEVPEIIAEPMFTEADAEQTKIFDTPAESASETFAPPKDEVAAVPQRTPEKLPKLRPLKKNKNFHRSQPEPEPEKKEEEAVPAEIEEIAEIVQELPEPAAEITAEPEIPVPDEADDGIVPETDDLFSSDEPEEEPDEEDEPEDNEEEEEEDAPKKKRGFFSHIKSIISDSSDNEDDDADDDEDGEDSEDGGEEETDEPESFEEAPEEPEPEESPADDESEEEAVAEEEPEAEAEPGFDPDLDFIPGEGEFDNPEYIESEPAEKSATELIDEAIAAINETSEPQQEEKAPAEEEADEPKEAEPESEDEAAEEAEPEEESDPVGKMLDRFLEDTQNAIADIENSGSDKKADEKEPEEEQEEAEDEAETAPEKPERKKGRVTSALRNILDEDPDELINARREKTEAGDSSRAPKKKKGALYTVLGVFFSIFAVIGVITVIVKGVQYFGRFTSGDARKDGFTEFIYPVVVMDITPFDEPSQLTSEQIVTATIWSMIMDDDIISKYDSTLGDTVSIPDVDVEKHAVELFGENLPKFEHCTVGPLDSRFYYSEGAYNVKLRPITFTYSPEITSIVKSGEKYTLTVDYIDELPSWMDKTVSKTAEYILTEKEDGTYRIDAMRMMSVNNLN